MGQKISRQETEQLTFYCVLHMDTLPVDQAKVLLCGHCFCQDCLNAWEKQCLVACPNCRCEDKRNVSDLPGIFDFEGKLFLDVEPEIEECKDIQDMIHAQIVRRAKTIRILRQAAAAVTDIELTTAGVKIGGTVASLVGTGLVITGGILSLTGVGAVAGVPLALSGAAVGGVGGLAVGGGIIGEIVAKNKQLENANSFLQSDFFHSMQLTILFGRAARNGKIAQQFNIKSEDAASFVSIMGRSVKVGVATANLIKTSAIGVARGVGTAGLHVAGIVIAATLIPLDLFQMIQSAIRVHNKEKAEKAVELEETAKELESQLIPVLKDRDYKIINIEKFDDEQKKHALLLAVRQRSKYEDLDVSDLLIGSNMSFEEIEKEHVILLDTLGDDLDKESFESILDKITA